MKIYRFNEFVNEGIFSDLLKGAGGIFTSKKSKIDSILSKIGDASISLVKESDKIKREIFNLHGAGKENHLNPIKSPKM